MAHAEDSTYRLRVIATLKEPPLEPSTEVGTSGKRKREEEPRLCVVCTDEDASVACVPCGHVCACEACSGGLAAHDRRCPVCRSNVERMMRVYF